MKSITLRVYFYPIHWNNLNDYGKLAAQFSSSSSFTKSIIISPSLELEDNVFIIPLDRNIFPT